MQYFIITKATICDKNHIYNIQVCAMVYLTKIDQSCSHFNNSKMIYITVTESESATETSCKIKGLQAQYVNYLENKLANLNLTYNNHKEYFEIDVEGIQILNILSSQGFKVLTQSMAIEYTVIGGGSFKIQKTVWTLGNDV